MRKLFFIFSFLFLFGCCLQAAPNLEKAKKARCLVLTNSSNFEMLTPRSLREVMNVYGGVEYDVIFRANELKSLQVSTLAEYDVVWVYNFAMWGDNTQPDKTIPPHISNVMADYVKQGGYLVTAMLVDAENSLQTDGGLLGGRYITDTVSPFKPTPTFSNGGQNMGLVVMPDHPVLKDIKQISTTGVLAVEPRASAQVLAYWEESQSPIAAVKGNVLAFNMPPVAILNVLAGLEASINGDGYKMINNGLRWMYSRKYDLTMAFPVDALKANPVMAGNVCTATLTWKNPMYRLNGDDLTKIDSIVVSRNGARLGVVTTNLEIGGVAASYIDQNVPAGTHSYEIVAYSEGKMGYKEKVSMYAGRDLPGKAQRLILSPEGDGGRVKWNTPVLGKNGGWFDVSTLKYKVVRMPDNVTVAESISEMEYLDNTISKLGIYYYTVTASNVEGVGETAASGEITLRTGGDIYMGTSDITIRTNDINFYDPQGPSQPYKADEKLHMLTIRPENSAAGQRINAKFSEFEVFGDFGGELLAIFDGEDEDAKQIKGSPFDGKALFSQLLDIKASPDNMSGALTFVFYAGTRPEMIGSGWKAKLSSFNLNEKDLSAKELKGELYPCVKTAYKYTATVYNAGKESVSNFSVSLFGNEVANNIETKTITEPLLAGKSIEVEFEYTPTTKGLLNLGFIVNLTGETATTDNRSMPLALNVQSERVTLPEIRKGDIISIYGAVDLLGKSSVTETMYYPTEIGAAKGKITAIRYYNDFTREVANERIIISVMETTQKDMSYNWHNPANFINVFDGLMTFPIGKNEIPITFTTPYDYKGGNLIVRVERPYMSTNITWFLQEAFHLFMAEGQKRMIRWKSLSDERFDYRKSEPLLADYGPRTSFVIDCESAAALAGEVSSDGTKMDSVKMSLKELPYVTYTDKMGRYIFPSLLDSAYTVIASKFDYEVKEISVPRLTLAKVDTLNIELKEIPKVSLFGKITDNTGAPIKGVKVQLYGYANLHALTNEQGLYEIEKVYSQQAFTLKVSKNLYKSHIQEFTMGANDSTLSNISLQQVALPALNVKAAAEDKSATAEITWTHPADMNFFRATYDDGTAETNFGVVNKKEGWFGNFFAMNDTAYIQSVDVYGVQHPYLEEGNTGERPLYLEIYDATRKKIYSSEALYLTPDKWNNIELPYVEHSGSFYAMFRFPNLDNELLSTQLGADMNGSLASSSINYYYDGLAWAPVHTWSAQIEPFVFMIRANILSKAETCPGIQGQDEPIYIKESPEHRITKKSIENFAQSLEKHSLKNAFNMLQTCLTPVNIASPAVKPDLKTMAPTYNVYRLNSDKEKDTNSWTKLSTTGEASYSDNTWNTASKGAYKYAVKATYGSDVSAPTILSNEVYREMLTQVSFTLQSNVEALSLEGARVILINNDLKAEHSYTAYADAEGKVKIEKVWKGIYKMKIDKLSFVTIDSAGLDFSNLESYDLGIISILEDKRPPYNLELEMKDDNSSIFTWNTPRNIEDGFEAHKDFAQNSAGKAGWTYRDVAGVESYAITGAKFPGDGDPCAYIVFNPAQTVEPMTIPGIMPYKGKKFLASFSSPAAQNDKWLISPKLSYTNNFTFSFFAKSFDVANGMETFMVGYSTTGTDSADFTWIQTGKYESVGALDWLQFSYKVPGQAKYVTVRCISNDQYIFMLDNVFIGNEEEVATTIKEYKVYLDGEYVTTTQAKTHTFTNGSLLGHKVGVIAVYASGDSEMSELVVTTREKEEDKNIQIYPNPTTDVIFVESTTRVRLMEIYNMHGVLVKSVQMNNTTAEISLNEMAKGIYIIKMNTETGTITKRIVKQ